MSPKTSGEAFGGLTDVTVVYAADDGLRAILVVDGVVNTDASSLEPSRIHTRGVLGHEKNLESRRASWWRCYWWSGDTTERGVLVRKFRPPNISFRQLRKGDERLAHLRSSRQTRAIILRKPAERLWKSTQRHAYIRLSLKRKNPPHPEILQDRPRRPDGGVYFLR
ncbi:hypothetical protein M407DRAFT_12640 [Tulasnella calospora MUT 4182]|uniref:Uncharacterized protein n=1 Tax=Tulasnella calospora MUT 4182 TaxID=1051891 RepID=A0A0C3L596_9AGAM|nr:hypothetical protein M407DRAFT_12640 [Tulasnella calospora MUT 4182]